MQRSLYLTFSALTLTLLTGCQHTAKIPQPPVATQLDQLSALLAGTQFLREHCARTDIPGQDKLQRTALETAEQRGWNTRVADYQQLPAQTETRFQALLQDNTPENEKCATLNRSTARFIAQASAR